VRFTVQCGVDLATGHRDLGRTSVKEKTGFGKRYLIERRLDEFCKTCNASFDFKSPLFGAAAPGGEDRYRTKEKSSTSQDGA
jgi:hypothetical protein